ncbi:MAG TPA: type II secretion system protein [Kiritimatiellae bacterium]|nr:type II secretion system protein [Kiritimatiellia bacterium]
MKNRNTGAMRTGFTIVEATVALGLLCLVITAALTAFNRMSQQAAVGTSQAYFVQLARSAEQKISAYIMEGKAVGIEGDYVTIVTTNYTVAAIKYWDQDGDPETVENNWIMYDPNVDWPGGEVLICNYVTAVPGESMFSILPLCPAAVKFCFHIGDGTGAQFNAMGGTGPGFQGLEVRFSAAPRNLQYWYAD